MKHGHDVSRVTLRRWNISQAIAYEEGYFISTHLVASILFCCDGSYINCKIAHYLRLTFNFCKQI